MEKLDYDEALKLVSPDVVYCNMPLGETAGRVTGPQGIRSVLEPFFAPTLSNQWIVRNLASSGGIVFMERLDRHELRGGWAELPVTGVFEVKDDLITSWRDYFDWNTITSEFATHA